MEELRYWLALLHAPGVGAVGFRRLLEACPDVAALFRDPPKTLPEPLLNYLRHPDWEAVDGDLAWVDSPDHHILSLNDPAYPAQLREIPDAPPLLFIVGDPELLASPQLAIVGSRNPTPSGAETAFDFARHFGLAGLSVTSGLALGVDAAAHRGCLDGGGTTLAVLGTGADRVYPARHRALAHEIVEKGGALVSEFPPGTPPLPAHFPRRNRIISGLALGTLVVEAALQSGSLITARVAGEQGREVFAIPGSIHNPLSRGCHRLLRDGAKLVETARDVLEELAPALRLLLSEPDGQADRAADELDEAQRRLLINLDHTPTAVDLVVERSGLTPEVVSSMLLVLELQGYVAASPGGRYSRTSKRV